MKKVGDPRLRILIIGLLVLLVNVIPGVLAEEGLVAEYHFDGDASDSSGYGNHGTLINGTSFASGISGQALNLDGIDDFVEVLSSESLKLNESISISLWFKTESDYAQSLIQKSTVHDYPDNYRIQISPEYSYLYWDYGNVHYAEINPITINPSSWYHLAVTVSTTDTGRIYINGQEASYYAHQLSPPNPLLVDDNPLLIGTDLNSNFFNGLIDEVRIYNKVLTTEEIQFLFDNPTGPQPKPAVTVGSATMIPGTSWNISVSLDDVTMLNIVSFNLSFDPGVVEIGNIYPGSLLAGAGRTVNIQNLNGWATALFDLGPGVGVNGSGEIAKISINAIGGLGNSTNLSLSPLTGSLLSNVSGDEIEVLDIVDGRINLFQKCGDVNLDGNINALDVVRLRRMIAGLDPMEGNGDFSSDGSVNSLDIVSMKRVIVGLDEMPVCGVG